MNFLKSKIIFAIIFCVLLYCMYEWSHNKGVQLASDDIEACLDEIYSSAKTDTNYVGFKNACFFGTVGRKNAEKYEIIIGLISAIYIIYFLKTNLK